MYLCQKRMPTMLALLQQTFCQQSRFAEIAAHLHNIFVTTMTWPEALCPVLAVNIDLLRCLSQDRLPSCPLWGGNALGDALLWISEGPGAE